MQNCSTALVVTPFLIDGCVSLVRELDRNLELWSRLGESTTIAAVLKPLPRLPVARTASAWVTPPNTEVVFRGTMAQN